MAAIWVVKIALRQPVSDNTFYFLFSLKDSMTQI